MSIKKINPQFAVLMLFIIAAAAIRIFNAEKILTPIANLTPIGAMAMFGGHYFKSKWKSYFFPLLTLFISDVVMSQTIYSTYSNGLLYQGWYWVYAAFAIMVLIGKYIKEVSFKNIVIASIAAALAHWVITDFGVWLAGGIDISTAKPFTKDIHGFVQCYVLAIPYIKNMLIGNLLYGTILFGGYELLQKKYSFLKPQSYNII